MTGRPPFSDDPIILEMAGERVAVPHRNAAEWVNAMHVSGAPGTLILTLAREASRDVILDELAVGSLEPDQLAAASYELLVQAVPHYRWWATARLLLLSAKPEILGRTVLKGMDPWSLSVAQWVTGIYAMATEHADEKDRFKFDAQLQTPPVGVEDDDWGDESFEAMVASARRLPGMG